MHPQKKQPLRRLQKNSSFAGVVVAILITASCGGGGSTSSGASSSAPPSQSASVTPTTTPIPTPITTPTPTPTLSAPASPPNEHGLFADSNGTFPTDADAGVFPNESGFSRSFSTAGKIDTNGPFFKSFGNGRTCETCHKQAEGFSVTTKGLQERFTNTAGTDPIFQLIDGANSPLAAVGTLDEKRAAYSMLLNRGVLRISLKVPAGAEFEVIKVDDPYQVATTTELSVFRRPLPSTNLKFLSDVMWDGRETALDSNSTNCLPKTSVCFASLDSDLKRQANNAAKGHAQAQSDLSAADLDAITAFEETLFTAQQVDQSAGLLFSADGTGGALALSNFDSTFGVNDFFGVNQKANRFNPDSFQLFGSWMSSSTPPDQKTLDARAAIIRGEIIFNSKQFFVKDLPGISDVFGNNFFVNCSTCHSTPNVGDLSRPHSFDIGLGKINGRTADMPLYTLKNKQTGEIIETSDPGRAITTGLWQDINRFKPPVLRGLASRPPYFHDGSAKTIEDVTAFYNKRFGLLNISGSAMTDQELSDLNAFLKAL